MSSDPSNDPRISQAYRSAAQAEPSPQLDARILQAAHAALAQPARKASRWSRLALPFATAVVAILATTVALQWRAAPHIPPLDTSDSSAPPTLAMKPETAPTEQSTPATPELKTTAAKPAPKAPRSAAKSPALAAEVPALPTETAVAPSPAAQSADSAQAKKQKAEVNALADAQPTAPALSTTSAARSGAGIAVGADAARAPAQERLAAPFRTLSKEQSADKPTPQQLEDIRKLKREGKLDAAKQATETLRKQFPHYQLPEDLRVLVEPTTADPKTR